MAGSRRDSDQRCVAQARLCERFPSLGFGERGEFCFHRVDLGERDDGACYAEQFADRQVLAGLWHHPLIRRHHQEHQVDTRCAGNHGSHEALVARYVDDSDAHVVGQVEGSEAQLDRNAPLAFLR